MTLLQAGAFPTAFLTAWYALHYQAHIEPGQKILVHSAAGGVGGLATQLAYTDTSPNGTAHTYWASAVSAQLAESPLAGPVTR